MSQNEDRGEVVDEPTMRFDSPKWTESVWIQMTWMDLFCLVGNVELALQHPRNTGPSGELVRAVAGELARLLVEEIPDFTPEVIAQTRWAATFGLAPGRRNSRAVAGRKGSPPGRRSGGTPRTRVS